MTESQAPGSPQQPAASARIAIALQDCAPQDATDIGGKALGLVRLIKLGLPVPAGFVIPAQAYRDATLSCGIDEAIASVGARDDLSDEAKSGEIRKLFSGQPLLCGDAAAAVDAAYAAIGGGPVAVRSSGIAEDTADASFAGQHDTYLWVEGPEAVRRAVADCWASLFNANAISYRTRFGVPIQDVAMAVVVQRMVPAVAAGVMMTLEPVTGDRSQIYIESAHGLGEGVVQGDVECDRFWVDKASMTVVRSQVETQTWQHAYDPERGAVTVQPLPEEVGARPSIAGPTVGEVASLGRKIESAFGVPMDVEWAVSPEQEVLLLQARPETVWANRPAPEPLPAAAPLSRGRTTMHEHLDPGSYYSTANLGEAAPGVLAPLTWSVWGPAAELAARQGFIKMGVLERSAADVPRDPAERFITIAYGRAVASVTAFYEMGERIPGASGDMIAESLLGTIPDGMTSSATRRRYPHVAWNMPRAFLRAKRDIVGQHAATRTWWAAEIARAPRLTIGEARAQFEEACRRFRLNTALQGQSNIIAVPPIYQALEQLVKRAGMQESFGRLTAGGGDHAETEVVADLWDLAHDRLSEAEFLARHGYHGAMEGDIAGRVWREDPEQVRRLVNLYRTQEAGKDPRVTAEKRTRERCAAEAELLAKVGRLRRGSARLVLRLARRNMPLRGLGKENFLRSLDVARAAARRIGDLLAAEGVLENAEDVMYLTAEELAADPPADVRHVIRSRKAEHEQYRSYELPTAFWGEPTLVVADATDMPAAAADRVDGIGVSAGVVEGVVRVVTDPTFAEVRGGEVLVARTTDPSWASVMLVSAALVVDIGGALSHAAVVARELGVPCVVGTKNGTSALRTGDVVRVDGTAGTVQILERAERDR